MARTRNTDTRERRQPRVAPAIIAAAMLLATFLASSANAPVSAATRGEVPTTGGSRPGSIGAGPSVGAAAGVRPTAIRITKIGVEAQIETVHIVDGVMQNPTGPWVVSWYAETTALGAVGNIVLAGHLDYWNVGRAVFYDVGQLRQGDQVAVAGNNGQVYAYQVDWVKNYDVAGAPIQEIVGPTTSESLTLITCGGPFDAQSGEYLQRTVVRAHRVTG